MAGPSAKQIPYGMDGIHMELASIPPGIRLECGGTVKTSNEEGITLLAALKVHVDNDKEGYTPLAVSKWEQRHDRKGYALPVASKWQ